MLQLPQWLRACQYSLNRWSVPSAGALIGLPRAASVVALQPHPVSPSVPAAPFAPFTGSPFLPPLHSSLLPRLRAPRFLQPPAAEWKASSSTQSGWSGQESHHAGRTSMWSPAAAATAPPLVLLLLLPQQPQDRPMTPRRTVVRRMQVRALTALPLPSTSHPPTRTQLPAAFPSCSTCPSLAKREETRVTAALEWPARAPRDLLGERLRRPRTRSSSLQRQASRGPRGPRARRVRDVEPAAMLTPSRRTGFE